MKICKKHVSTLRKGETYTLVDSGSQCQVCRNLATVGNKTLDAAVKGVVKK